jgi:hypothetical protein
VIRRGLGEQSDRGHHSLHFFLKLAVAGLKLKLSGLKLAVAGLKLKLSDSEHLDGLGKSLVALDQPIQPFVDCH